MRSWKAMSNKGAKICLLAGLSFFFSPSGDLVTENELTGTIIEVSYAGLNFSPHKKRIVSNFSIFTKWQLQGNLCDMLMGAITGPN